MTSVPYLPVASGRRREVRESKARCMLHQCGALQVHPAPGPSKLSHTMPMLMPLESVAGVDDS